MKKMRSNKNCLVFLIMLSLIPTQTYAIEMLTSTAAPDTYELIEVDESEPTEIMRFFVYLGSNTWVDERNNFLEDKNCFKKFFNSPSHQTLISMGARIDRVTGKIVYSQSGEVENRAENYLVTVYYGKSPFKNGDLTYTRKNHSLVHSLDILHNSFSCKIKQLRRK